MTIKPTVSHEVQAVPALESELRERLAIAHAGGAPRYHERVASQGKLFVRRRLELLFDQGSFVENGTLARTMEEGLPADGVVTGVGRIAGRPVAVIANDPTVKAGAWGKHTVRKYLRQQDEAERMRIPLLYLTDSAGARLDEGFWLFTDRGHAGKIFYNQARLSGTIPQLTILFGPSPAGAAYLTAFCDVVIMVDGNASAYLGSPRTVKMATGEDVTAEEMGGARMHCTVSGLGDHLAKDEPDAIAALKRYLEYLPQNWEDEPPVAEPIAPANGPQLWEIIPEEQSKPFDMMRVIERVFDEGSIWPHRHRFAKELITAFARLDGRCVGIVANQPKQRGAVLTTDSSDKGAQFVQLCNAFAIPLVYLADTPGYMVGTQVERGGIIRHGAKFLSATAATTVPRIAVMVRKCYGAAYLAMSGAVFQPDVFLALPQAKVSLMSPEAAVNSVHYNRIQAIEDPAERAAFIEERRKEFADDVDLFKAAGEFYVDEVVSGEHLRRELVLRLEYLRNKPRPQLPRHHAVIRG